MRIKRFVATAVLSIGAMVAALGVAGAEPVELDPAPAITAPVDNPAPVEEDPQVPMHQCNALLGALVGGVIGGTASALPGALIGAGIGALIGWSLLYPPGPPLACWQPPAP